MKKSAKSRPRAGSPRLATPTDLGANASKDLSGALNALLADVFALYMKTKNFHWHMSGPHFRDYHLLLDEHATQIFAMTDVLAERVRKVGGNTLRSIGDITRHQRLADNDAPYVDAARTCWRNCATTISALSARCARCTIPATSTTTSPPPACSRTISTRPRGASGSCTRAAVRATRPGIEGGRTISCVSRRASAYAAAGAGRRLNVHSASAIASITTPPSSTEAGVAPSLSNHCV